MNKIVFIAGAPIIEMSDNITDVSDTPTETEEQTDDSSADYWENLVKYARIAKGEPPLGDFGKLQIINITHLLNQLACIKAEIEHSQSLDLRQAGLLRHTLHQYGTPIVSFR